MFTCLPPLCSGLARRPLKAVAPVRIRSGVPVSSISLGPVTGPPPSQSPGRRVACRSGPLAPGLSRRSLCSLGSACRSRPFRKGSPVSSTALVPSLVRPSNRVAASPTSCSSRIGVALIAALGAGLDPAAEHAGAADRPDVRGAARRRRLRRDPRLRDAGGVPRGRWPRRRCLRRPRIGLGRPAVHLGHRRLPGRHARGGDGRRLAGRPRLGPQGPRARSRRWCSAT